MPLSFHTSAMKFVLLKRAMQWMVKKLLYSYFSRFCLLIKRGEMGYNSKSEAGNKVNEKKSQYQDNSDKFVTTQKMINFTSKNADY